MSAQPSSPPPEFTCDCGQDLDPTLDVSMCRECFDSCERAPNEEQIDAETIRSAWLLAVNALPLDRIPEERWTPERLERDFEVLGFLAPFVVVVRRSDGARGTLIFRHSSRFYFGWQQDRP